MARRLSLARHGIRGRCALIRLLAPGLLVLAFSAVHSVPAVRAGRPVVEIHYAPAEDLERIDAALIASARHTLDISMYTLTDRFLAEAVVERARHGVRVRIYRDQRQWQEETQRASFRARSGARQPRRKRREERAPVEDAVSLFLSEPRVQIRVKNGGDLQHLKAYAVDGQVVRDGSANWSAAGEKRQDNSLVIVRDRSFAAGFERNFEEQWNRPDGVVVQ